MERDEALDRVAEAPVARLATTSTSLGVDVVPITFALADGRSTIVTAVDHKPKSTANLRRLRNIAAHPIVTVLVDHYEDDWHRLWWVRIKGTARVVADGPVMVAAIDRLVDRYDQHRAQRPEGPAIVIAVDEVVGWSA